MHHIAVMTKSWNLIPKILSSEKTMESRWYQTKRAPWKNIIPGDTIFFKNSGAPIIAQATVSTVHHFELKTLADAKRIIQKYGKRICLPNKNVATWPRKPRYCVLIGLTGPKVIKNPFHINKKGFGNGAAWLTMRNINSIKL